jgi:tRNA-2-methylthio-N6-dimethylallyladenosine synthase
MLWKVNFEGEKSPEFEESRVIVLHFYMRKSVFIYTYGCQMNVHDSEKMLGVLSKEGYDEAVAPESADLIIFNTCAIRAKAEQKFYSQLGRIKLLKRKRPDLKIGVAGCVAQDEKRRLFARAPFLDFILGPQNIHLLKSMTDGDRGAAVEENPEIGERELAAKRGDRVKAWVSIIYGCNNFCSYCIVPYTRGREVSRPSHSILSEIENLGAQGYKEVTLLGQNVNSYRSDIDFPELLRRIDSLDMERVRFVTSHPRDLSPNLVDVMAELPSVCEHIHLPIQSGSDRILKVMNRGYTRADYMKKMEILRKTIPGLAVTTDVIAGFPGETDGDHEDTVKALREIEFDGIFAFKFSPRKGTRAYEIDAQLPDSVKGERLDEILRLQEGITYRKNKLLEGTIQEVLIEGRAETGGAMLTGRTRSNKIVMIPDSREREGSLSHVLIETARQHSLYGKCVRKEDDAGVSL